jgi:hypothetical protein
VPGELVQAQVSALRVWQWWWDLPGQHWWFPDTILGHEMIWSVNNGGPVAWPGRIRCAFRAHVNDGYDNCCYCGWWEKHDGEAI